MYNDLKPTQMLRFIIFQILIALSILGCSKSSMSGTPCLIELLEKHNMQLYIGQDLDCKSYLDLYHFNGEEYYLLNNNCIDMISNPVNCEGDSMCSSPNFSCQSFYLEAERIKIIGITKE